MAESDGELRAQLQQCRRELELSEARFRNIIERNADGIIIVNRAGIVCFANSAAGSLWNCSPGELLGRPFGFPLFVGETTNVDLIRRQGFTAVAEMRVVTTEWEGETAYLASLRDITERKQAEAEIRFQAHLLNTVEQAVIAVNQAGRIIYWNRFAETLYGWTSGEVLDRQLEEVVPDQGGRMSQSLLPGKSWAGEVLTPRQDGTVFSALVNRSPLYSDQNELIGAVQVSINITEQKRAEEEIRRRNRELALLNRVIAASAAALKPETVLDTACRELGLAFDLPHVTAALLDRGGTDAVIIAEYRLENIRSMLSHVISVAGHPGIGYMLHHREPLAVAGMAAMPGQATSVLLLPLLSGGEVVGMIDLRGLKPRSFAMEEISLAWSVAEQVAGAMIRTQLGVEHRRLSAAIEQTADSVVITDTAGVILYVNPAFERTTGYTRAEVMSQSLRLLKSDEQEDVFYQELWAVISAGEVWHGRFVNRKKDGSLYTADATITPVRDENGAMANYVGVHRDVTRELQLERQYREAQKMEAVGLLAGGIAHDFNNLLTAINGFTELLQLQLEPDSSLREYTEKILNAGHRAADLVRQLLAFSRKQIMAPQVLSLNAVVKEMDKMLQRVVGEHILVETQLASDLWLVKADLAQLEQVIVNLVVNARDAMPTGGHLAMSTANIVLDEDYALEPIDLPPGEYVLLTVRDSGIGMSDQVKAHLFEPFFTTKEVGKGTGLGLATVFGIVKQSGGHVEVFSEEGQGTSFNIYLPRTAAPAPEPLGRAGAAPIPRGTETILLVEDDIHVRELARRILQRQGYTLLEARDGQEALRLPASYSGPIHLLLTDVVMPGMSGKTVAEQLAQTHPSVKILFMSGYADSTLVHHGMFGAEVAFIQKPFTPAGLAQKVRELLDIS